MKLITRNTDYAVRVLRFMAGQQKNIMPVSVLIKKLKIPRPFLRKIMYILSKKGIVVSFPGTYGGFQLAVSANRIFLLDLIEIFQGPFELNKCIFRKKLCREKEYCRLQKKMQSIEKDIKTKMKTITIKSLS